jgi:two-component system sensor histidine kinase GlrK
MVMGFGIIILVMIAVQGYLLYQMQVFSATVNALLALNVRSINALQALQPILNDQESHARKYAVLGDTTYALLFRDAGDRFADQVDSLKTVLPAPGMQTTIDTMRQLQADLANATVTSPSDQHISEIVRLLRSHCDRLEEKVRASTNAAIAGLQTTTESALRLALLLTFCAIVGTIASAFIITKSITKPLAILRDGTERVARGEFTTIHVSSRDETADLAAAFNDMSARLKRSNDLRAEMMQQISHEIRIPLQIIHSADYVLHQEKTGPLTDEQRKLLGLIRANTSRIGDFADQFLDLAKIEAGMMTFTFEESDLASVLTPAVEAARLTATEKQIALSFDAQPAPVLSLDRTKIGQVAMNLFSNAVKYTPSGGAITVEVRPAPGGALFRVRDTGAGIHPDDLPHLFTKFYQAQHSSTVKPKGTGLGLALVKAIVEEHGGRVSATSTPGQGSTFTVELPCKKPSTIPSR